MTFYKFLATFEKSFSITVSELKNIPAYLSVMFLLCNTAIPRTAGFFTLKFIIKLRKFLHCDWSRAGQFIVNFYFALQCKLTLTQFAFFPVIY